MDPHASRVLGAVLEAVGDAAGYPDVLFRICRAVVESLPCDRAAIYTYSRQTGTYLPRADHGTPAHIVERFVRRGFNAQPFVETGELEQGRVLRIAREGARPDRSRVLEEAELAAIALVPLAFNGEAEGTITCGLHHADTFTPDQIDALERVASHVALLVRNARLESEAERVARRRTWLATWAAQVFASTDVLDVAQLLSRMSRELFRATDATLLLVESDELVARATDPAARQQVVRIPIDVHAASTDAFRAGRVLLVNDYPESSYATCPAVRARTPASVLAAPLVDDAGSIGVLVVWDGTHRRRFRPSDENDARILATVATAALRKVMMVDALTRANRAKSDFLASVSHDLRTPLNIITGYAQLLHEGTFGPLTREQDDILGRVLRTASDQLGLINDLLDLARIEQGKLQWTPTAMRLATLVPKLTEMMEALLRDRPVRFEADVPPGVVARADPERVRQVLVNLLTNAAKFTQEGCVRLVAACEPNAVRLTVEDTGCGIDPELRDRVLEPFVRGSGPQAGSGLGLAIVARLLTAMDGAIAIESVPGTGTRVAVRLPAP